MTREAIEYFKFQRKIFCEEHLKICPKDSIAYQATLKEKEFYDMAIKALEQEPILDKIRAEIKALPTEHTAFGYDSAGELWILKLISSDSVLEIIDKYKAEFEPQERSE